MNIKNKKDEFKALLISLNEMKKGKNNKERFLT